MSTIYYIRDNSTYCFLNKRNEWSHSIGSYGLMTFETEEKAKAAVPPSRQCSIIKKGLKEQKIENAEFVIYLNNKILNQEGDFVKVRATDKSVMKFATEEIAADKVEEMKLNLDQVKVVAIEKK